MLLAQLPSGVNREYEAKRYRRKTCEEEAYLDRSSLPPPTMAAQRPGNFLLRPRHLKPLTPTDTAKSSAQLSESIRRVLRANDNVSARELFHRLPID